MSRSFIHTLLLVMIVFTSQFLTSCTKYNDLVYLQVGENESSQFQAVPPDYRIQQRDILFIRVLSRNKEITQVINSQSNLSANQFNNEASLFIYGYNVSDSGYVEIPILGKIVVANKTLEEAKRQIKDQANQELNAVTVFVKAMNHQHAQKTANRKQSELQMLTVLRERRE